MVISLIAFFLSLLFVGCGGTPNYEDTDSSIDPLNYRPTDLTDRQVVEEILQSAHRGPFEKGSSKMFHSETRKPVDGWVYFQNQTSPSTILSKLAHFTDGRYSDDTTIAIWYKENCQMPLARIYSVSSGSRGTLCGKFEDWYENGQKKNEFYYHEDTYQKFPPHLWLDKIHAETLADDSRGNFYESKQWYPHGQLVFHIEYDEYDAWGKSWYPDGQEGPKIIEGKGDVLEIYPKRKYSNTSGDVKEQLFFYEGIEFSIYNPNTKDWLENMPKYPHFLKK